MIRRVTIAAVGRLNGWADQGCEDYLVRLRRYFPVDVVEVPEGERHLKRLATGSHVIALDRARGKPLSSEELALKLDSLGVSGRSHVAFVLGGPLGLSPEVLERADERLSFGPITLPHALARLVLLEQLYRAVKIVRGEKYHW